MPVYIPCLNPDKPDSGGGFSVGVGVGGGGIENPTAVLGISVTHSDSPIAVTIAPVPPFVFFGPNFAFWSDLFGLGETRIEREKEQIQDILTSIFRFLKSAYGVPLRDNHALQFQSDGVQAQFVRRPDIAALVPYMMAGSETMTRLVFASRDTSQGQRERVVNQFLANAAINDWPVSATVQIWDGMLAAAHPDCASDASRWAKNPEVVVVAAELAVLLQYISLPVLTSIAARGVIGNAMAQKLVYLWADNPSLVADIPYRQQYDWQSIYQRGEWALPPWASPLGIITPLYQRQHIKDLLSGVSVKRPTYPDFASPGQGGIQPAPQPQPQPPPQPQPQPEPTPQPQPEPTPVPQPPGSPPVPQPYPDPPPQPPPPPPNQQVEEIPNAQDYRRACDISRQFGTGLTVSEADLNWLTTVIGSKAITWAVNQPLCGYFVQGPNGPLPDPSQPDCPPYTPYPPPDTRPPENTPLPQPYPYPQPQPRTPDGFCDPDCQVQIDLVKQRQKECCDKVDLGVIPRLENLEWWMIDLERRLPGPQPPLPHPEPIPPYFPSPPEVPPDGGEGEEPPGEEEEPPFSPACIERLKELCEPDALCEKVKECERELECVRLPLCDPQGGPWGGMAECWHDANQTPDRDVFGVYRGVNIVQSVSSLRTRSYEQAFGIQSQQPGVSQFSQFDPRDPTRYDAVARKLAQQRADEWTSRQVSMARESVIIPSRPWIFADPAGEPLGQVKIRQPKLRPGEVDPCSVEPPQALEIPPTSNQ